MDPYFIQNSFYPLFKLPKHAALKTSYFMNQLSVSYEMYAVVVCRLSFIHLFSLIFLLQNSYELFRLPGAYVTLVNDVLDSLVKLEGQSTKRIRSISIDEGCAEESALLEDYLIFLNIDIHNSNKDRVAECLSNIIDYLDTLFYQIMKTAKVNKIKI